jgi:hypothetical protein
MAWHFFRYRKNSLAPGLFIKCVPVQLKCLFCCSELFSGRLVLSAYDPTPSE